MGEEYLTKAEHAEFVRRYDENKERTDERLKLAENRISDMQTVQSEIKSINQNIERILETLRAQGERLDVLEDRDGDTWRSVKSYLLTFCLGILVTYIAVKLGIA